MNVLLKIAGAGVSVLAGLLANRLLDAVWKKVTGSAPPRHEEDNLNHSLRSALTFALVSASIAAVIQTLASRGAKRALVRWNEPAAESHSVQPHLLTQGRPALVGCDTTSKTGEYQPGPRGL